MATIYLIIVGAMAFVAILYLIDRRNKNQPFVWEDLVKYVIGTGGLVGGVAYSMDDEKTETEPEVTVPTIEKDVAQDMFVGKPTF
jgi:hypothetical protein